MFTLDKEAWAVKRANLIAIGCKVQMCGKRGNRILTVDTKAVDSAQNYWLICSLTSLVTDYGWSMTDSAGSVVRYRESRK